MEINFMERGSNMGKELTSRFVECHDFFNISQHFTRHQT